ncbi:MAG: glycosyl transferase [Bacteroidetes bacterium]|nr:glycosyl transferase [Bacteroidota bacterium]
MKRERFNSVSAIGISHPVKKLAVGALCSVCVFALLFVLLSCFFPLPAHKPYSLLVEDRNGEFLQAFLAEDGIWRLKTSPDEIPERLKQVLIEKEDKYFYYHPGINPFAVCRALIQNISAGRRASGASTLTMQVARMLERRERTYPSKLIEVFRALQLEWTYSKDEILRMEVLER